jgi:GntR family transcriptional regulator / MocR family aminotransferase
MRSCAPSPLPPFAIDPAAGQPRHRQLYGFLRRTILEGPLEPGANLPSQRSLARMLGVSRNTVLYAYEKLRWEGLIAARAGSGTRVAGRCRNHR